MRKQTKIIFFTIALLFTSCSPQKRLESLLKNHPELTTTDTLKIIVPVTVPAVNDSFVINYRYKDTTITCYASDSVKLTYTVINDSIAKVFIRVPPKTIYVTQKVPVEKIIIQKPDNWGIFLKTLPYLILGLIVCVILGFIYKK